MALDNRDKSRNPVLDEVINDDEPLNDAEQANPQEETPEEIIEEPAEEEVYEDLPTQEETPEEEKPQLPPVEERLKQSSNEALLLNERNNQLLSTIDQATNVPEPSVDELKNYAKEKGSDWEDLSAFEKGMLKDTYVAKQQARLLSEGVRDIKQIDEWGKKVDSFIKDNDANQQYKGLLGLEDQFRKFAMQQTHRGLPLDVLVPSFLFTAKPAAPKKRSLFSTGSGGEKVEPKKKEVDDADYVSNLRKNNPLEYKRLIRAGKIKVEI